MGGGAFENHARGAPEAGECIQRKGALLLTDALSSRLSLIKIMRATQEVGAWHQMVQLEGDQGGDREHLG